jgi:hypothetical protein
VGSAVAGALESPEEAEPYDMSLEKYVGNYDLAWGGELAVFQWKDGLAMLYLPSDDPVDAIIKLKHVDGHTFRRLRDDGELGEEIVFEVGADGIVTRLIRHSNYSVRIR